LHHHHTEHTAKKKNENEKKVCVFFSYFIFIQMKEKNETSETLSGDDGSERNGGKEYREKEV
jgi:hypothetical protein